MNRDKPDRISEAEIRDAVLAELAGRRGGFMTTSELIRRLENKLRPGGRDHEILDNRSDTPFSQKVRNLVSHRRQGSGLERIGFAKYDANKRGWRITRAGRAYVREVRAARSNFSSLHPLTE
ncbi:hypothetical protein R3X27_24975 [Tropicimonas sp. TH_r6]|uniref:hypothetical protein n=1 Tax=Tropicimonas sp. TH_r6 TaxID=3082085 RepID=UPI00295355FE|nr:hypothetical protein [Tropicimonas sp. TH_r6]MDV7145943.1 hypothetical protein [Tropicimonas sp. TH_r6]